MWKRTCQVEQWHRRPPGVVWNHLHACSRSTAERSSLQTHRSNNHRQRRRLYDGATFTSILLLKSQASSGMCEWWKWAWLAGRGCCTELELKLSNSSFTIAGLWRYRDWRHVATGCTGTLVISLILSLPGWSPEQPVGYYLQYLHFQIYCVYCLLFLKNFCAHCIKIFGC